MSVNALVLSGGGARAAYQAGVMQALADLLPDARYPFDVICGTSAGAINAVALAAHMGHFRESALNLADLWRNLTVDDVFKSGWLDLMGGILKVGASLLNNGVGRDSPLALFNNKPLSDFLSRAIQFENIQKKIEAQQLRALSVTATSYQTGESVAFYQGLSQLQEWRRSRRMGMAAVIQVKHLLASSAIPTIFPAVLIDDEYFGDGALRQTSPLSPALHLGANRLFIVGVSNNTNQTPWSKTKQRAKHSPSMAQIVGQMFNSAFIDSMEGDLEHMQRVNALLDLADQKRCEKTHHLVPVETLVISPSKPLDKIAGRRVRELPRALRYMLRRTGATAVGGGSAVASYLLFCHGYCNELMDLGYNDAMWEQDAIHDFFKNSK